MPPCESILGYVDLTPSDSDEEHSSLSSLYGVVGCIIDLTGSDSRGGGGGGGEHAPVEEEVGGWGRRT
jgi:hypothetical protein